jgi:hypothetical protein
VPKQFFRPPNELIQEWPEIFEDLYMSTMPVSYINSIRLEFSNGGIWEIDVREQSKNLTDNYLSDKILETFYEYKDEISKVDFSINIEKLKKDIQRSSKKIL